MCGSHLEKHYAFMPLETPLWRYAFYRCSVLCTHYALFLLQGQAEESSSLFSICMCVSAPHTHQTCTVYMCALTYLQDSCKNLLYSCKDSSFLDIKLQAMQLAGKFKCHTVSAQKKMFTRAANYTPVSYLRQLSLELTKYKPSAAASFLRLSSVFC